MLCSGVSAQAAITHPNTGVSFGPGGVGSGNFESAAGVAVQQASGDVFVLDKAEGGRVYKFDAAGEPVDFSGSGTNVIEGVGSASGAEEEIAVDDSKGPDAGDVYVANNQVVRIYAASGAFLGELSGGEMCGVAVDPSGSVYVGIYPETVRRYKPITNPVTNAQENGSMAGLSGVCNVAADGEGNVYAATFGGGVTKYDALQLGSLSATGTAVDSGGRTLAVDPLGTDVFIDEVGDITQYDGSVEPPTLLGTSGSSELSGSFGVAVDHASGKVYAAAGGTVDIFGPGVVVASATTEAASGVTGTEATLNGTVEPSGTEVTACAFEYGTEAGALNQSKPCSPAPPYTGSAPVAATAQLTGLQPGTAYRYRIVANGGSADGQESAFTTRGPIISNEFANEIGSNRALAHAKIDPGGEATTYRVEYGTTTAYGSSTPTVELEAGESPVAVAVHLPGLQPLTTYHFRFVAENPTATALAHDSTFTTAAVVSNESFSEVGSSSAVLSSEIEPGGESTTYTVEYGTSTAYGLSTQPVSVGAGEQALSVVTRLSELQPGVTYHFRFVAKSAGRTAYGPDAQFNTRLITATGLPDARGYEMVTPAANQGGEAYVPAGANNNQFTEEDLVTRDPMTAAADGDAVSYAGAPSADGNGNQGQGGGNEYVARRTPGGGWTQTDIQPKGYLSPTFSGFSTELDQAVLQSEQALTSDAPSGFEGLYVRSEDGGLQAFSTVTPPNRPRGEFGSASAGGFARRILYAGASPDYSHQLFEANDALAPGAVDPGVHANNLYESVDGELHTVNILPDGSPAPGASFGAPATEGPSPLDFAHAISSDGSRIFWSDMGTGSLYVREDGTRTSLIAESADYLTASSDGSKVIYKKAGDLYEDDLQAGVTHDLAPGGGVLGLVGASEDLEYIYFVAEAELASGATSGEPNLYLLHDGETQFIATLGGRDSSSWLSDIGTRTAEVTPSGHDLTFMSVMSLTGYDNVIQFGPEHVPAAEVYVYDADDGALSCASCDPTGERPAGTFSFLSGGFLAVSESPTYQLRLVSEDGSRVFFESDSPLLPAAQNGKINVYEWERDGAGSCGDANGCIYLLTPATSSADSYFIDASANGNDVFLVTRSQLVGTDKNEYNDVYDARVDAAKAPAAQQCTGTGCQGTAASPPVFATPASATFAGVGNFAPTTKPVVKPKPKPKPKKPAHRCVAKKPQAKKSAKQAKAKSAPCKVKKAAKHTRHGKKARGGR
jgi:hypothetical protein